MTGKKGFLAASVLGAALMVHPALSVAGPVVTVDVEKILKESEPGKLAGKHVEAAKDILQKGLNDLQKEWKDAPEKDRNPVLEEGLRALNRQMLLEENAARQVVVKIMQEECRKWRSKKKNQGTMVIIPLQNVIDADTSVDITDTILKSMEKREPKFADLPRVDVKNRKEDSASAKDAK